MFDLSGKVALVTGGSRGIGSGICTYLAQHGAAVAINYKESEKLAKELKGKIEAAGGKAMIVQADVRLPEDTERMVQETIAGLGRLDILVNNAGFNRDTLILRMSLQDWDEVMDLKLRGGRSINIGSVSGLAGNAGQANYAAAKSGLIGFTRAVAREMGSRNITANLIAPGLVITELTKDIRKEIVEGVKQRLMIDRFGTVED